MALPSLALRLAEFESQIDTLLAWHQRLPPNAKWRQALNELRFVRATLSWEEFLEQAFLCYLRGSRTTVGRAVALKVPSAQSMSAAEKIALGNAPYGKWMNESWLLSAATRCFSSQQHPFLSVAAPVFKEIRLVRNRIVHRSEFARTEFQGVVRSLYGSQLPGLTPGRLLSDTAGPSTRIDSYLRTLKAAASVIAS